MTEFMSGATGTSTVGCRSAIRRISQPEPGERSQHHAIISIGVAEDLVGQRLLLAVVVRFAADVVAHQVDRRIPALCAAARWFASRPGEAHAGRSKTAAGRAEWYRPAAPSLPATTAHAPASPPGWSCPLPRPAKRPPAEARAISHAGRLHGGRFGSGVLEESLQREPARRDPLARILQRVSAVRLRDRLPYPRARWRGLRSVEPRWPGSLVIVQVRAETGSARG